MSTENYEDIRELWKSLRNGVHYAMGSPPSASMLNRLESSMRSKFITTGGLLCTTSLMLANISANAKKQAYLMRTQQMLPLSLFNGEYL